MRAHDLTRVEPRKAAVDEWAILVEKASEKLLSSKIGSWQTGVNHNVEGRNKPRILGYNGGAVRYRKKSQAVAEGGYREFEFRS